MTQKVYGRSRSMQLKHEMRKTNIYIGCTESLIFRTIQDRPQNENALRGMYD